MNAIIIDDEENAQVALKNLLNKYCSDLNVVAMADGVESGLETIRIHNPDIVFLDIQMDDGSGFDLLKRLKKQNFNLIFTTAFDSFPLLAFKYGAIDYLLKPIDPDELITSVERCTDNSIHKVEKGITRLEESIQKKKFDKIALSLTNGIKYVEPTNIIRCEAESNYTNFYFKDGKKILIAKTLKSFQDVLCQVDFIRIHNSHIVNLNHIVRYFRGDGGVIEMIDGSLVPVARSKKSELLKSLGSG
jgi:two-component system, LytTR family, response regulator